LTGDVIVEANGVRVANIEELIDVTSPRMGQPTQYVIVRDGRRLPPLTITPEDMDGRGIIGVRATQVYEQLALGTALRYALTKPIEITGIQIAGVTKMLRERTTEDLTGPVGMVKAAERSAARGLPEFVILLITISLALGFFNLLPFPALDGGRLVFLAYELITRKRPNEQFEAWVHTLGILFLLGVLVLVTYRDFMS
jgi:regulator of sigma E protease